MFSRGLSPGVTSGPVSEYSGLWRESRESKNAATPIRAARPTRQLGVPDGRAPAVAGRETPGATARRPAAGTAEAPARAPGSRRPRRRARAPAAPARRGSRPPAPAMQPAAGLPRRSPQAGPAPRTSNARSGGPALPPLPRNYSPAAGGAAAGGGGVGRARIREAPQFGAAPVETATARAGRRQPAARGGPQAALVPGRRRAGGGRAGGPGRPRRRRPSTARPPRRGRRRPSLLGPSGARARLARDPAKAALPFAAPHPRGHHGGRRRPSALRSA